MEMNKKNTVIFDLDGTLLDTLEDLTNSANYTLEKMNYPLRTLEEIRSFVGNGIAVLVRKSAPEGTDEATLTEMTRIFKEHYALHCNDLTRPYDGIMDLIGLLQEKKVKMAIVSNKGDFAVKDLAEIYFKGAIPVAIGEKESEGIRKKPAPDTVFKALELLGSSAEDSVYVGDSEVDVLTASNAGLDLVLCSWGFREESFLKEQGAGVVISDPAQLPAVIGI